MSADAAPWAVRDAIDRSRLGACAKAVLHHVDRYPDGYYRSAVWIAVATGWSLRSVRGAIAAAKGAGWLATTIGAKTALRVTVPGGVDLFTDDEIRAMEEADRAGATARQHARRTRARLTAPPAVTGDVTAPPAVSHGTTCRDVTAPPARDPDLDPDSIRIPPLSLSTACVREGSEVESEERGPEESAVADPVPAAPPPEAKPAKRKPAKKSKLAHALPADWTPDESVYRIGAERGLDRAAVDAALDGFRDHALANGRTALDWTAAARTWIRRERPPQPSPSPSSSPASVAALPPGVTPAMQDEARRLAEALGPDTDCMIARGILAGRPLRAAAQLETLRKWQKPKATARQPTGGWRPRSERGRDALQPEDRPRLWTPAEDAPL